LLVQNRQRVSLMIRALCLGVNVALNAFFLHTFRDPRGTALATVVAEGLSLTLSAFAFRAEEFSWGRVLPAMGRVVVLGAVTAAVMLLLGQVHWLLGASVGLVVYGAGVLFGRVLSHDDWLFVTRFLGALPMGTRLNVLWARLGIPH
jgi:peptidoglycan biosynthesis protein MviN/MurJ (putative lipid II flippase)